MSRLKLSLLPYLPVAILPLILFAGSIFRWEALYWGTPGLQFIPWRWFIWDSLVNGTFPLWNPLNGMGAPLIANYQTALFYPPGWILYLFAAIGGAPLLAWAHTLLVIGHLMWAGIGMVHLLRSLGLSELSQAVGAVSFAMGGYLVGRSGFASMIWTAAWLPWVLLAANQIASPFRSEEKRPFLSIWLIVAVAFMLLAGHAQLSWYILLLAAAWVMTWAYVHHKFRGVINAALRFGAATFAGALLAAVQLLPTAEYLFQSQRSSAVDYEAAMSYSFWPWRFLTLLAPDLFGNPGQGNYWGYANYWEDAIYIGLLPILLALATVPTLFRRNSTNWMWAHIVRFAWITTGVGFLLALGKNTPVFPFLYRYIPTFDMFNGPSRWLVWPLLGLTLLAAIGAERWRTPIGKGLYWLRLATAGGFAVSLGAFLTWFFYREVSPTFIQATALAGLWGLGAGLLTLFMPDPNRISRKWIWMWLVVIWVAIDLLAASWFLNPTVDMSFYQAKTTSQAEALEGKRVYLSIDDEYYLKFRRFLRFEDFRPIENPQNLNRVLLPNLNLLVGVHSANNFDPMVPGRYAQWMQHLTTLNSEDRLNWLALMNVGLNETLDMQEDLGVRFQPVTGGERIRWFRCATFVSDEQQAFDQVSFLLSSNRWDQVVLEDSTTGETCTPDTTAAVTIESDLPGKLVLQVQASGRGWVFLADTWYPGWEASVNGQETTILRANYLFRAVEVQPGMSEIEFRYRPISFTAGLMISAAGWLIVLLSIIMMKIFARKKI
jgi:hypothetical protein